MFTNIHSVFLGIEDNFHDPSICILCIYYNESEER